MPLEQGRRLGPYEITGLRGKGGMGEVYRARDVRLDRDVAIKVLPAALSLDPTFRKRLEREAKAISQLQHPHVCALHDVGSQDGVDYLVMEYLEGETLDDRLRRGALPLPDVLRIGREIAEAVEAAHRRDIVHRDLKPGNVMLTAHGTKVLDFGLAKGLEQEAAVADSRAPTFTGPLTEEGTFAGTLPYMAPEQLEGKPADARSDLWALGCLLYEMATGERPFRGASQASLIAAILGSEPEPFSRRQPPATERLDSVIGRCLAKDPERRWQSARDVAIELEAIAMGTSLRESRQGAETSTSDGRSHARRIAASPGSPFARRWIWPVGAVAVVLLAGVWWWFLGDGRDSTVVDGAGESAALDPEQAVLPFTPLDEDPATLQLARSIPQEMSARLAARGESMLTPVTTMELSALPCEAVRGLAVGWLYHGSVARIGERVRVTAQLTQCPSGRRLWGDAYSRESTDLLAGLEEIVTAILATSQQYLNFDYSTSTWMELLGRRTEEDNARGVELASRALEADPIQARNVLAQFHFQAILEGWAEPAAGRVEEMVRVAEEYLDLAPRARDSHALAGYAYLMAGDRVRSIAAFERSVEIAADTTPATWGWLAHGLAFSSRGDDAITSIDAAVRASPNDAARWTWERTRGIAHFAAGRYVEARDASRRAISFNINDAYNQRAFAYEELAASLAHLGEVEEARAALEEAVRLRPALTLSVAARSYAAATPEHRERYLEGLRRAGLDERGLIEWP